MAIDITQVQSQVNIEEQKQAHAENIVHQAVVENVHVQVEQQKLTIVQMAIEDEMLAENVEEAAVDEILEQVCELAENDDETLNVFIPDLLATLDYAEDIANMLNAVGVDEGNRQFIEDLFNTSIFFNDVMVEQTTRENEQAMQAIEQGNPDLFQQLIDQQEVFETERGNQEAQLFQNLNIEGVTDLAGLQDTINNLNDEAAELAQRIDQNNDVEQVQQLERQSVEGQLHIESMQAAYNVAENWLNNLAAADALALQDIINNKEFAYDTEWQQPVVLNALGLPEQIFGAHLVGPAYGTEEDANMAAEAERLKRVSEGQEDAEPHRLRVQILDQENNTVHEWWELSEFGQNEKHGHTEQKALTRIDLDNTSDLDYTIRMEGMYAPCQFNRGCELAMDTLAEQHNIRVVYRDLHNEHVYPRRLSEVDEEIS